MKFLLALVLSASLAGCKTTEVVVDSTAPKQPSITVVGMDSSYPKDNPAVTIKKSKIEGNTLTLIVEYSGGCEVHDFELLTKKLYRKSLPPQLDLFLKHDNKGDACREIKESILSFDISQAQYPDGKTKEVVLRITDGNSDPTTVNYKY